MNDGTRELVACNVLVTPALTRRIRKAAFAEHEGRDPRSALMIAAGYDPDEIVSLRARVHELTGDANESKQRLAAVKAKAEKCAADLSLARKHLSERDGTIEDLRRGEKMASERIAAVEDTLQQSVEIGGLPTEFADDIRSVLHAVRDGDDPRSAFLAAANYDRSTVDDALSSIDRFKTDIADLERRVAPLSATLEAGGVRGWVVRRMLGL